MYESTLAAPVHSAGAPGTGWPRIERSDPEAGVAVCTVTGDVDSAAVGLVRPAVRRFVDDQRLDAVVVDLSRVGFLALRAVDALLELAGQAAGVQREFLVVLGGPAVARSFELTGAEAAMHCYQHGAEALAAASARAKYRAGLESGVG